MRRHRRWGERERGKEVTADLRIRGRINGPYSKIIWAESQLRLKVWHCRMPSPALLHGRRGIASLPKIVGVSYNLYDSLCIRYGHISLIYHDQKQIINTDHDHDT